jgi:hypothetical protein
MTAPDRLFLFRPLTTLDEGCAFIKELIACDLLFHFEDDPSDIIKGMIGGLLFNRSEANAVRQRVRELYSFDWSKVGEDCPIGYALTVEEPEWKDRA